MSLLWPFSFSERPYATAKLSVWELMLQDLKLCPHWNLRGRLQNVGGGGWSRSCLTCYLLYYATRCKGQRLIRIVWLCLLLVFIFCFHRRSSLLSLLEGKQHAGWDACFLRLCINFFSLTSSTSSASFISNVSTCTPPFHRCRVPQGRF